MLGHDRSDWLGTRFTEHVHLEDRGKLEEYLARARGRPGFSEMLELRLNHGDGQDRWFEIAACNRLHDPSVGGFVLNIRDATDRRRLERERAESERLRERVAAEREKHELQARLQQAERLESVGALAGGVAHDFNNLLAVILNYVGFLRDEHPEGSEARADVDAIGHAAQSGARLTEQLLAFGQRKLGETEILDVDEVIADMSVLLDRPLGSQIELRHERTPDVWPVRADPTGIEQITLNLVVNARQAGGGVAITSNAGSGTTVDVYLPASNQPPPAGSENGSPPNVNTGGKRILLVEAEAALRDAISSILQGAGYEVAATDDADRALELLTTEARGFDLLLTDVIMPGVWGDELATQAQRLQPGLPTLFMSGFSERFLHGGRAPAPGPMLTKPFREDELLRQTIKLISARPASRAA